MELQLGRFEGNPILTPTKHAWENKWVYNCGVTKVGNRVALLYRAQGDDGISRFGLAFTEDGYHVTQRLPDPVFAPDPASEYERYGVEDPRITEIDGMYYVVYTAASQYPPLVPGGHEPHEGTGHHHWRVRVSIAHTTDFHSYARHGIVISHIDSKDGAMLPEKIQGKYILIHRVNPQMRLALSDDLYHFKERGVFLEPSGNAWENERVGIAGPPLKTPQGWLMFYHAKDQQGVYRLGLTLLDLHDPSQVLARTDEPIFAPQEPYEKEGKVSNVIFSCGTAQIGDRLFLYYGAADAVIGVATIKMETLLTWAEQAHARLHQ